MKPPIDKKHLSLGIMLFLVIAASILFYMFLENFSWFTGIVSTILGILSPIILGFVLAYILNPVLRFFENKCFSPLFSKSHNIKNPKKVSRALGVFTTIFLALAIIAALIWLVIPQLFASIAVMASNIPNYITTSQAFIDNLLKAYPDLLQYANSLFDYITPMLADITPQLAKFAGSMASGVWQFASSVINFFVGIVVSIYVLYSKEIFASQFKRVCYALFNKSFCKRLFNAAKVTDKTFGGFISGKILDSFIIGVICFIVCSIFGIPYTPLVSVLVGVTNIIPFFGPFFGAIPSAFIILLESPIKSLIFIIFVIILQQVDGNLIGPKILGDSTGLSAFWVIFAILVGGGLFGVLGMFIGVPVFAVIYTFFTAFIDSRLQKKNLPVEADKYKGSGKPDFDK